MKRKFLLIILFAIIFVCMPSYIYANSDAIISGNTVRIRQGAGTNNSAMYTVNSGTPISVIDNNLFDGDGCDDKWYKIKYKDETGYVCSRYVKFVDNLYDGITTVTWTSRLSGNNVNIRSGASTKYSIKGTLSLGVNVKILETINPSNSGCSTNKWYKIQYDGDEIGYICSKYIINRNEITANDEEYTKTLKESGFPDSYIPYLTYMHKQHPEWKFIAKNTDIDFASAVSSEEGKNYMQTKNDNYRTSSTPAEGSSWFRVNNGVIAFYMDPRNFLYEERLFMFEKLDYTSDFDSIYPNMIKSVFGSGALSDDKYTIPMFNAGKTNKISPVHIASRIKLEVGANGSASTSGTSFTWRGEEHSGYYNFFNIGAYETTIDGVSYSAVTRGLAYAAKLIDRNGEKWDNIETAITEGSSFLANGYITKGQGTLYYQKFNVSPEAYYSRFTHQYMTNIQAPAIEGNQSYNSYNDSGIINEPFIFEIPVYNNMPAYTSLPNSGDMNDNLKSLEVENYSITPVFDNDILTYEVFVPANTEKINVKAETDSKKATLSGIGEIELKTDKTDVTITVVAELGNVKKYTVTIIKVNNQKQEEQNKSNNEDNNNQEQQNNTEENNQQENNNQEQQNNTEENNQQENNNQEQQNNTEGNNQQENNNQEEQNNTEENNQQENNNQTNEETSNNETTLNNILKQNSLSTDGDYIVSIKNNTNFSTLQNELIKSGSTGVTLKDNKGNTVSGNDLIGTGFTLTIKTNNETKDFKLIINGDTSGDGKVTILDLLQVQKHIKGDKKLSNEYLLAGDTSGDNKVTILDLLQVQKHIKGDKYL